MRENLNKILSANTGRDIELIRKDTDRDNFLEAEEALAYGIIDKVIARR
jgi:ATP-dependent Clp protease protease subunit